MELTRIYNRARVDDRLVNELLGLCHGLLADGVIEQGEAEYLHRWLDANRAATGNPMIGRLYERVADMLQDGKLDPDEQRELLEMVVSLIGGVHEPGELAYATTLPLTQPPPSIQISGSRFCFTGTFAFVTRAECERAVADLGGEAGSLTKFTDYLVIGIYATDSWAHSSYGRKIEKAVEMRATGATIAIVGEAHWAETLNR